MIEVQDIDTDGTRTAPFAEGDGVTGRRWGEADLITGRFVEFFGTDNVGMLVDLPSGDRAAIVTETASKTGRHRAELLLPHPAGETPADLKPLPGVEQTVITPDGGVLDPEETTILDAVEDDDEAVEPVELDEVDDELEPVAAVKTHGWLRVVLTVLLVAVDRLVTRVAYQVTRFVIRHARGLAWLVVLAPTVAAVLVLGTVGTLWWLR